MRITKQGMRTTGIACGAAAASALLAMTGATQSGAVSTAIVIGGLGTPTLHDVVMSQLLGGALQDYDQRVSVNWPAEARPYTGADDMTLGQSIEIGRANLNAQIDNALDQLERDDEGNPLDGEEVTVVGLSAGSLVVTETLRGWQSDDEEDPEADDINFVVVADSSRQEIIDDTEEYNEEYDYTYRKPPETVYDTVEITGEYDGMADFPDRFSLTAIQNAMLGSALVHVPMMFSDLSDVPKENTTVTENALGGTTVRYLVPTETLPIVQANPRLAPREAELRATIDRAYVRNDPANVAARLAGPDVPERIRDIVTPDAEEPTGVDLVTTAALQETAEEEAATETGPEASRSLSEQINAAASTDAGEETAATQPTANTLTSVLRSITQKLTGAADEDGAAALTPERDAATTKSTDSAESADSSDASESETASDTDESSSDQESADSDSSGDDSDS